MMMPVLIFSDIRAHDEVWIIGDRFVFKTCEMYFTLAGNHIQTKTPYMKEFYDIKTYSGYEERKENPHYLARMVNQVIKGINARHLLPKAIVIVMEDDLIYDVRMDDNYTGIIYTKSITWIAQNIAEVVANYKKELPVRSKRFTYPKLLWISAPFHKNFEDNHLRKKANNALYHVTAPMSNMNTIKLKGDWDSNNARPGSGW